METLSPTLPPAPVRDITQRQYDFAHKIEHILTHDQDIPNKEELSPKLRMQYGYYTIRLESISRQMWLNRTLFQKGEKNIIGKINQQMEGQRQELVQLLSKTMQTSKKSQ